MKEEDLIKSKLWICTTEKFEALLRKKSINKITEEIETIVIDEIHNLSDKNRGQTLESLISRYRNRSPQKRVVGLSATLKNDEEFAAWLNSRLIKSLYRQSIINKEVVKYESNQLSWREEEIIKGETLTNLIKRILVDKEKNGSILVFCFAKATCLTSAFELLNYLSSEVIEFDKSKLEISNQQFEHLKKYKIGINFSGFNKSKLFLDLFEKGEIKYLFTTSGLSAGINSPAKNVIIRDCKRINELISLNEIQQMFGRAARDKGSEGWAFLITPASQYTYWIERINQDSEIHSVIGSHLEGVILAEIYLGNVINENEILDWYSNSFRSFQEKRKQEDIKEEIIESLDFLLKNNFVIRDSENKLNITKFGDASIKLMVDLKVALNICKALPFQKLPNTSRQAEIALLKIICGNIFVSKVFNNNLIDKELLFDYCKKLNLTFSSDNNDDLKKHIPLITAFIFIYEKEFFIKYSSKNLSFKNFSIELFEEMDRYCSWLSMIGTYTESPWISFCAYDLSYRFRYWKLNQFTYRGSCSLINFLEKLIEDENKEKILKDALSKALEKNILHPNDLPKSMKRFTFSNDTKQIKKLLSNLVNFNDFKIAFDKKINKFRIIDPPKNLRTTFSQVIASSSGSNIITFIEKNEEIILEVPSITSTSEIYYVLILFETYTDKNIIFIRKELGNLRADNSKQDFYNELSKIINLLPDTQIIKSSNSIFEKIKSKLKINNINLREIDELVARRDYYLNLLQLLKGISKNPDDICININYEINKILNMIPNDIDQMPLRSVPSILKSGKATILEREIVKLTLFVNSNINAAIVQTAENYYHCIVQVNTEWFSFENLNNKSVTPIWPKNFKIGSLRVLIKNNIQTNKNSDINLNWIEEFNHPINNISK